MSRIQDYPTLAQAIQDFSHRSDLGAYQDYFIQFAESNIYRDIFVANMGDGIKLMEETLAASMDPVLGTVPVPTDFLAMKAMQVQDGAGGISTLVWKDAQWIYDAYPQRQGAGIPAFVARDGSNFIFGPMPDGAYAVSGTYWSKGAPLSASNPTNWMTAGCPDLLFVACMVEVQPLIKDSDSKMDWKSSYTEKLNALVLADSAEKWGAATMQIEVG